MRVSMLGLPNVETQVPIYDDEGNHVGDEPHVEVPPVAMEIERDDEGNVVAVGLTFPRHLTYDQAVLAALAQHVGQNHDKPAAPAQRRSRSPRPAEQGQDE